VEQAPAGLLRLNLETRSFHDAADEGWLSMLRPSISRSDYMRRLVTTYGFEAPRAGLIAKDLLALGLRAGEISALPQCLLAPFSDSIEALGWMYVSERATLIHDRVRRHLATRMPDSDRICEYLDAYYGVANARWNGLGHAIDDAVRNESDTAAIVAAARSAFRCLIDWSDHARSFARGA
jgi:heme oxygenase